MVAPLKIEFNLNLFKDPIVIKQFLKFITFKGPGCYLYA